MKVKELIEELNKFDGETQVEFFDKIYSNSWSNYEYKKIINSDITLINVGNYIVVALKVENIVKEIEN